MFNTSDIKHELHLSFLGLEITLEFYYKLQSETLELLSNKYSPFKQGRAKAKKVIKFFISEHAPSLADPLWNTYEPFLKSIEHDQQHYLIVRDFICRPESDKSSFYIYGPEVEPGNPDTLDNALLLALAHYMPDDNSILLHAAAVLDGDQAYLFFAPSGNGKTTFSKKMYQEGLKVIASDSVLLSLKDDSLYCQCPPITDQDFPIGHPGKATGTYKVSGICFLEKLHRPYIQSSTTQELLTLFMKEQLLMYFNFINIQKTMDLTVNMLEYTQVKAKVAFSLEQPFWDSFINYIGESHE